MATSSSRCASLTALTAQAQALASAQALLVADLLHEGMHAPDGVADAALVLSQLGEAAAAAVLAHLPASAVLALAEALLRQRSVPHSQAEQVLSHLLAEAAQRVLPLAQPKAFVQQVLPQALGDVQGQRLLQVLGLAAPVPASPAAARARLSQAEVEALLSPAPPPTTPDAPA